MESTAFFAKVMGIFFLVSSCWVLFNTRQIEAWVKDFLKQQALVTVTEMMTLLVGAVVIVAHTRVGSPLAMIVTIIGWSLFIKSMLYVLAPERTKNSVLQLNHKFLHVLSAVVGLALGFYLLVAGMGA